MGTAALVMGIQQVVCLGITDAVLAFTFLIVFIIVFATASKNGNVTITTN
jgi:hypothetical protein